MDNPKNQLAERIKEANNVLVTVSASPSVDQLAAAIGLTLLLNKLGKHATAVYSGATPSTIEFLQPEETLEKNTDSLRDFIIALDKSKADKLRYKVEDKMVKIFITPYRTSISDQDLEFSQGDFNVDVVIGLGVKVREDLDQAITTHGRILHDATVASLNLNEAGNLGSLNWVDNKSSSLCEMVVALSDVIKGGLLDEQIATALMTGIVAETERFSNAKTTSSTMSASAKLMTAGANQQLIATKLEEPEVPPESEDEGGGDINEQSDDGQDGETNEDGSLNINHDEELPEPEVEEIDIDDEENTEIQEESQDEQSEEATELPEEPKVEPDTRKMLLEPPMYGGDDEMPGYEDSLPPTKGNKGLMTEPPTIASHLSANTEPEDMATSTDPLKASRHNEKLLSHNSGPAKIDNKPEAEASKKAEESSPKPQADEPPLTSVPQVPAAEPIKKQPIPEPEAEPPSSQTLTEIEQSIDSPHLDASPPEQLPAQGSSPATPDLDQAREAVQSAVGTSSDQPLEPIAALNAQPVDLDLGHNIGNELPDAEVQEPIPPANSNIHIDAEGNIVPAQVTAEVPPIPTPAQVDNPVPSPAPVPTDFNPFPAPSTPSASVSTPMPTPSVNNPMAPPAVPPPLPIPSWPPQNSQPSSSSNTTPFPLPPSS